MVTIEQKLTLFSKLLNQDIKEEATIKMQALEKEYEKRMAENKFETDKEANELIEQTRKRAELKRVELISKGKLASKKEMMQIREELIDRFMVSLNNKVRSFTDETSYKDYLTKIIEGLDSLKGYENDLVVYLTASDLQNNKAFIEKALVGVGLDAKKLSFEVASEDILGGLIIKDPVLNMRIDESIRTLIDEAKDSIVEKITIAIGEAGDEENE